MASNQVLRAIEAALQEMEGDESLGRRIRANNECARLLQDVSNDDFNVARLCRGRAVPSLLVALMDECGETREVTRNAILESLARVIFFVDSVFPSGHFNLLPILIHLAAPTCCMEIFHRHDFLHFCIERVFNLCD